MGGFPIGVNTWVWTSPLTDGELARLVPRVAGWGFDVIELPVEQPGDWDPARAADLLAEHGLRASVVLVMPPGRELVAAPARTVEETRDYLRHCVDVAVTVGSPVIGGPAYASVGRTWPMSAAERTAAYAELRAGLLTLDLYHLNIEEKDPAQAVRAAAGRLAHVQVCGTDRGTPGSDRFRWPDFTRALREVGYAGPLVIESFTAHNRSIATAASIWRPLAPTQDRLATDGIAFLRTLA